MDSHHEPPASRAGVHILLHLKGNGIRGRTRTELAFQAVQDGCPKWVFRYRELQWPGLKGRPLELLCIHGQEEVGWWSIGALDFELGGCIQLAESNQWTCLIRTRRFPPACAATICRPVKL
jgi:hypothetical protein